MEYKFKPYERSGVMMNHLNLGGSNDKGNSIDVTSMYIRRSGKPWIGVMGEFHFSRCRREDWYKELCKIKAGGVTIVATYLFWIYHEETEGKLDFSQDLDIRAFVAECARAGLDVVLRVGPWAHGECRNGGFPDWLLKKPYRLRSNDPGYLEKARAWYRAIFEQVEGMFYKDGGNIIGIQLENELTDGAEHLAELKKIAVEEGGITPIYTVTGWNSKYGAKIPVDEVLPVFGAYCEAPWTEHTRKLEPSSRYTFNRIRNDSAIGVDLIKESDEDGWRLPYERYPYATCEIGGGIQITHHRRPIIRPMDIYALSLVLLGCGNNLIGYYMYHGGTNKLGKLSTFNESKDTGYPNDYPILSYDFQAPLSEYGEAREHYGLLNKLHMFVNDFGEILAPMEAVDSETEVSPDDTVQLRYNMRTDGRSGFVFVNHYQRLMELSDIHEAVIDTGSVKFPPIDVCGEVSFFMPFNMQMGDKLLEYATAQPLCIVDNTYFFAAIDSIAAEYKFEDKEAVRKKPGLQSVFDRDGIKIVTLTPDQARFARKLDGKLYVGEGCDIYKTDGEICAVQPGTFSYYVWNGEGFDTVTKKCEFKEAKTLFEDVDTAPLDSEYMKELYIGGERKLTWKRIRVTAPDGFAVIPFACDTAQIYADGKLVADEYYYGVEWRVPAELLYDKECYLVFSELRDDFYREF